MTSAARPPAPRWAPALVVVVGALIAILMLGLGLWQMQVFRNQGQRSAEHRAAEPAVALLPRVVEGAPVGDVYGRTVTARGRYVTGQQLVVVGPHGARRVLSALALPDGRVLPVVRGTSDGEPPAVPTGERDVQGVFMPAEAAAEGRVGTDEMASVRLQELAQRWPQPLVPGFVTLDEAHARADGLPAAVVTLPEGDGALRNASYALQWWVFAGFALGGAVLIARSLRAPADDAPVESEHDTDAEPAAEPSH